MRHVLLTGATGFVGRHLLSGLLKKGCKVSVVVRDPRALGDTTDLERIAVSPDIFSEPVSWWQKQLEGVDSVLHAAWHAVPPSYIHSPVNIACLEGSLKLAEAAILARIEKFVGFGTCFEYDLRGGIVTTETLLNPSNLYAASKASLYFLLQNRLPKEDINFLWCRLFYLYGDGEHPLRLVPYLHQQLKSGMPVNLGNGEKIRDYLDIQIAAEKIIHHFLSDRQGAVNICSGKPLTVRELAEKIADQYGRRDLLRFGTRPDNPFDPDCVIGVE